MDEKKYLLVKGIAGLGNRILFLLSALLYARLTERLPVVDWCDPVYSNDGSDVFTRLFTCAASHPLSVLSPGDSIRPEIWRHKLQLSAKEMVHRYAPDHRLGTEIWRSFSADLSRLNHTEDILVAWSFYPHIYRFREHLKGPYAPLRWAPTKTILKQQLRENLRPHASIQERIQQFRHDRFQSEMVGVHVRYTDKRTRLSALHKTLQGLLKRNPALPVFLATDNARIQAQFEDSYPHVISTPKWYPGEETRMHNHAGCPDRLEHAIGVMLDMYLLASCNHLILDERSAFSYVVSMLTDAPSQNVYNLQPGRFLPPWLRHLLWLPLGRFRWIVRERSARWDH